jgi:ferric-dicitrate binding protein FerR (iron transport regulator)
MMDYSAYSVEDFAADAYFISWVNQPTQETNQFWDAFQRQYPEKKLVIEEARFLVTLMTFEATNTSDQRSEALLKRIDRTLGMNSVKASFKHAAPTKSISFFRNWYRVAAVLLGTLLVAGVLFFTAIFKDTTAYTTQYGETRTIMLPDGTEVTLNANSSLEVVNNWDKAQIRKVKLRGEAFFSVVHTHSHQKFVVVSSENADIEVLGTTFNVNNRRGKMQVVLSSGKVKLNLNTGRETKNIFMHPGEMVEVADENKTVYKSAVKPETFTSWRNNLLTFDDTPLWLVAQKLEDDYGIQVEIRDSTLAQRKYTGSTPANQVHTLLTKLSKLFDVRVIREGNRVILHTQ